MTKNIDISKKIKPLADRLIIKEEDESKESHKQELQESIVRKATGGFTAEIFGKPLGVEPLQEEDMIEIMKAVSNGMSLVQAEDSDATTKVRSRIADSSDEYPPKVDDVEAQRSEKENKVLDFCKNLRNFLGGVLSNAKN